MSKTRDILVEQIQKYTTFSFPDTNFFGSQSKRNLLESMKSHYSSLHNEDKLFIQKFYVDLFDRSFNANEKQAIKNFGKHFKVDATIGAINGSIAGHLIGLCLSQRYLFQIMTTSIGLGVGAYLEVLDSAAARNPELDITDLKQKIRNFSVMFNAFGFKNLNLDQTATSQPQIVSRM